MQQSARCNQGVHAVSSTTAFLAGGINGVGWFVQVEGENITQVMDVGTSKICMMTQVV